MRTFLAIMGRTDEAVEHAERSIELDPYNPLFQALYGMVLVFDRRYDDAIAAARAALDAPARKRRLPGPFSRHAFIAKGMRRGAAGAAEGADRTGSGTRGGLRRGLAEGGYEGAQLAIADLLAERYEMAKGVPDAGAERVFLPVAIAWRFLRRRRLPSVPSTGSRRPTRSAIRTSPTSYFHFRFPALRPAFSGAGAADEPAAHHLGRDFISAVAWVLLGGKSVTRRPLLSSKRRPICRLQEQARDEPSRPKTRSRHHISDMARLTHHLFFR